MLRLEKFTQKAQEAIQQAFEVAEQKHHAQIEPEHLIAALLQDQDSIAYVILNRFNISIEKILNKYMRI